MDEDPESKAPNRDKARRAARDPHRPGEKCQAPAGAFVPEVNRARCEGKKDCVEVCPYHVFEVRRMAQQDFDQLSFLHRLKSRAHGRLTSYTPRADECHACGLCVVACPEDAIRLVPVRSP
jgi:4Fe-4S ferredoxin